MKLDDEITLQRTLHSLQYHIESKASSQVHMPPSPSATYCTLSFTKTITLKVKQYARILWVMDRYSLAV